MPICHIKLFKNISGLEVPFSSILAPPRNMQLIHIPVLDWLKYCINHTST